MSEELSSPFGALDSEPGLDLGQVFGDAYSPETKKIAGEYDSPQALVEALNSYKEKAERFVAPEAYDLGNFADDDSVPEFLRGQSMLPEGSVEAKEVAEVARKHGIPNEILKELAQVSNVSRLKDYEEKAYAEYEAMGSVAQDIFATLDKLGQVYGDNAELKEGLLIAQATPALAKVIHALATKSGFSIPTGGSGGTPFGELEAIEKELNALQSKPYSVFSQEAQRVKELELKMAKFYK